MAEKTKRANYRLLTPLGEIESACVFGSIRVQGLKSIDRGLKGRRVYFELPRVGVRESLGNRGLVFRKPYQFDLRLGKSSKMVNSGGYDRFAGDCVWASCEFLGFAETFMLDNIYGGINALVARRAFCAVQEAACNRVCALWNLYSEITEDCWRLLSVERRQWANKFLKNIEAIPAELWRVAL